MAHRSNGLKTKLAVAAALLPLCWAIIAHAAGTTLQPVSVVSPKSNLSFSQYLVDKGRVDPAALENAQFRFVNSGSEPLTITRLSASCGCLQPVVYLGKQQFRPDEQKRMSLTVPPGARGVILLRVQTANQLPGAKEYYVTVESQDQAPRFTELTFRMQLPKQGLSVQPRALAFSQRSGIATEHEITVTDRRAGSDLIIKEATCASDLVDVELGPPQDDEQGVRTFGIQLKVAGVVPPGSHVTVVRIFTDDERYPELRVPIRIDGPQEVVQQASGESE